MAKYSLFQIFKSLDESVTCLCILAPVNLVSVATNKRIMLFFHSWISTSDFESFVEIKLSDCEP